MEIREKLEAGILFLRPITEHVDATMAAELKAALAGHVSRGALTIALDLSDVQFMDSAGLSVLISTLRLLERRGELLLCGVRDGVLGLLRITSMVRILSIYESEEEILADRAGRRI
jgi:anti-sigma B factor antagonist